VGPICAPTTKWELIRQGNIAMAIILAAVIISLGIVVASITK
jgi:uncharacterized membrane protein YjfL (UPF0719 family)